MKEADKLMQTIRERNLKPLPKSFFQLRNGLIVLAFLTAITFGALAFSVILFAVQQTDFDLVGHMRHSRLEFFLGLLPFFWIIALVVFIGMALYSIQYAPRGYKLPAARWVGYATALSVLLGALFFIAGGARRLEHAFDLRVSLYESVQEKKIKLWTNPGSGYLSGILLETAPEQCRLRDFSGREWVVLYNEETFIAPIVAMEPGEQIKLVGKQLDPGRFQADEIRPWGGFGQAGKGQAGKGQGARGK